MAAKTLVFCGFRVFRGQLRFEVMTGHNTYEKHESFVA